MFKSYDKFRQQFGTKNLKLCFSDTDSFLFQVKCGNLIQKLKEMVDFCLSFDMFDFSKYDKNQVLYNNTRANHLFYFKDEMKSQSTITDFIGLRPKCYAMKIENLNSRKEEQKKFVKD